MTEVTLSGLWPKKEEPKPEPKPEPKEEPKKEEPKVHRFSTAVGWCPECGQVEARDLEGFLARLKDVRKFLDERLSGYEYVCETCGLPLAKDPESVKKLEACPWCSGKRAVRRK